MLGQFTVSGEASVIPAPKLTVVVPCTKCVNWPVIATDRFCWSGWLVFGLTRVSKGAPLTVNPLVSVTISAFVVSVRRESQGSSNPMSLNEKRMSVERASRKR